jgi:hypothetical protein
VCNYLTSGFAWPVRPRDAGPGADHRTGRVGVLLSEAFLYPDPPVRVACGADRGWGAKKSISVALRNHWLRLSAIT